LFNDLDAAHEVRTEIVLRFQSIQTHSPELLEYVPILVRRFAMSLVDEDDVLETGIDPLFAGCVGRLLLLGRGNAVR
jgi:hypothetical protein